MMDEEFTDWENFYYEQEPDFADLYSDNIRAGSGSEHVDTYVGSMLGLMDIAENPDMPATDALARGVEDARTFPFEDTKARAVSRSKSVLANTVQRSIDNLSELYAETGDPAFVEQAPDMEEALAEVDDMNLGSQVAVGALAALKNEELSDVDRAILARQAQLAMVGEFLEAADLGWQPLLGSMIPFRNTAQFVGEYGVTALADYEEKLKAFRSLMDEEKIRALPQIMIDIWEMSGENAFMFQDRILPFIDAEDIEKVYSAFAWDAFDAATIIPLTKIARFVKAAVNPARFARNAGARKVGAKIVTEAASDPTEKAAQAAGTTRIDAGASARPFLAEGMIPEIVDGLSPEAQEIIVQGMTAGRQRLNALIYDPNLIIKRSPLTETEIANTQKKYIEQFGGNARITESDELGFTVEFDVTTPSKNSPVDWSHTPNRIAELQGDIQQYQARLDDLKATYKSEVTPDAEPGYVRLYGGEGAGARKFTRNANKAGQGGKALYVDVPEYWLDEGAPDLELPPNLSESARPVTGLPSDIEEVVAPFPAQRAEDLDEYRTIENVLIQSRKELNALQKEFSKGTKKDKVKTVQKKIRYTRDDVGILDATEFSKATSALNSPDVYINQMMEDAVKNSTLIGFTQQQVRNFFEQAVGQYINGLSRSSKNNINSILLQADADKIGRYSTADLMNGIATKDGLIRLTTPKEILAYHGVRDVYDTAYLLKNRQLRRELEFEDWKSVKLNINGEPIVSFVKPAYGAGGHKLTSLPDDVRKVYDFSDDAVVEVDDARTINARLESGEWLLLKSKYPTEVGDELIEYIVAKSGNIKRLPDRVLAYRAGYVPRIYKNVFYIAEEVGKKVINGTPVNGFRSVKRYFSGMDEAEEWAGLERAKGRDITIRPGREWLEMHPEFKQDYEAAVFGGMYSGKRADEVVPFGLNGTEGEHIGAFEAMEKALSHVSTRLPINEFRMGMIRRFLNSARDPVTGKSYLDNPGDWRSKITGLPDTSKEYQSLHAFREWMEDQFRIPTAQERYWGSLASRLANVMDGKWSRGTWRMFDKEFNPRINLMNLAQKDIFASMRSVAFHTLLGWFNPAQLYVQALGASMAISVAPAKATFLIPRTLLIRAAMFSDNPEVWARTGLAAGIRRDDAIELVRAFRKSGVMDSVRSTADFDAAVHGYGLTRSAFSRAADKGLIFFREGETVVRTYGWLLAHSEFMAGKKVGYKLLDKDIDAITKRSLVLTMNLNRANRAYWQKGFLSIPTQFMQITAKFIENMAYSLKSGRGNWTAAEKAKIMSGQAIMFGAAGIPFGQWAAQGISEWAGNSDDDFGLGVTDPEKISAIRGGLAEWSLYQLTGDSLAISQRVSIPAGIESFVDMVLRSDATLGEKIAGAFGEVPGRLAEALNDILPVFVGYTQEMESFDGPQMAVDIAWELGDITSTFRNIHKAFIWENTKSITDHKGNPIIPLDLEEDHSLIMAKAMGLEARALEDYYNITRYNSLTKKDMQNVADAWIRIAQKYANSPQMGTPEGRRRVQNMISWLNRGLTEDQRADVAQSVMNKLRKDEYKITKELLDAVENIRKTKGQTSAGYKGSLELNSLMVPERPTDSKENRNGN